MTHHHTRRTLFGAAVLLALGAFALPALAQDYPNRPVKILVGTPAGSSTDLSARVVADGLTKKLGQTFVVENRPGAATNIASGAVARATADGYTLLWASNSNTMNVSLMKDIPFDFAKDFAPVAMVVATPLFFVINPEIPAKSVAEFVTLAKAKPGQYNFATTGAGSANHLAIALFSLRADIKLTNVFYKGSTEGVADVIAGRVHAMFSPGSTALPQIAADKVRALAVTSAKRMSAAPNIPTMIEAGIPGYEVALWNALAAPAATPAPIVEKLSAAVVEIVSSPEFQAQATKWGAIAQPLNAKAFGEYIRTDIARWAEVTKAAGIQPK